MPSLLLYGAYGYVGTLIAREAVDRGLDVTLAGRDREQLEKQVRELDQPALRFDLSDPVAVAGAVDGFDCVLNCAGPFSDTAAPLVEGCLETGADYVDVTGEIPVVERVREYDREAVDAGVTLLPSVGFSSIPMDCLAAHLADRLPAATHLALGVDSVRVPSVGSLKTVIEGAETESNVYEDGRLERIGPTERTRTIDFGRGERPAVAMPLGDLSTAHYTTGVPNVEVYAYVPRPARVALRVYPRLEPLLSRPRVESALKRLAGMVREGPSERARERGEALLWGEARNEADGERAVSRLRTPDAYVVTVQGSLNAAERVLAGEAGAGYQTPAGAFGPEFALDIEGTSGFFDSAVDTERRPAASR
ncbi:saccharopine dehydrogenase family protein [Halomicrobium salinisoli]|uniref:saccharopine dehydrogenase family protein n=1 Tax=Halomicrobium salinisoli TaxID=2878391 RepID=UPI001CF0858C|nr:saccharopine dehydrogenase NADP-binding domain-containing protein [Halomicrobium salinisoli]